jgi:lipopolysaccharide/colanic/teichoic acid biosynthesis glycosyltransferase
MNRSAFSAAGQAARTNPFPLSGPFDWPGLEYELGKRLIDVVASLLALILLMPLLVAIVVCVRLSGRGPILFRQQRLGRHGKHFWCYKFRTMVPDAESLLSQSPDLIAQFNENYKIQSDPRVTRVGAILRRTSLDELPQFWNVLRGDMSLIGPRPIVEQELDKYGAHAGRLLSVKPGLGGIWQVSGRSDTSYAERVAMDLRYIETRSLGLDLKLMILTAVVVIRGKGAY